ncbi:superinfection immunity protein [Mycobacterium sp.]|uniref:superinfection immunity protein n=1 Tax=Mycobacterium sp. TaxID=1785 RepID=UPI003C7075E4
MLYELLANAVASPLAADGDETGGGAGAAIFAIFMFIFGAILYFIPTIVATTRKVRNAGSVFVVNLFLGWTLIGWVIALAMSVRTVDRGNEIGDRGTPPQSTPIALDAPQKLAPRQSTNVKCYKCQHVQAVPLSQPTFICEQCNTKLKRAG